MVSCLYPQNSWLNFHIKGFSGLEDCSLWWYSVKFIKQENAVKCGIRQKEGSPHLEDSCREIFWLTSSRSSIDFAVIPLKRLSLQDILLMNSQPNSTSKDIVRNLTLKHSMNQYFNPTLIFHRTFQGRFIGAFQQHLMKHLSTSLFCLLKKVLCINNTSVSLWMAST